MTTILVPSKEFSEVKDHPGVSPDMSALEMVKSLTENQCRYALWAMLALLFGDPASNAPELLRDNTPHFREVAEGHVILCQIGMPRSNPEVANRLAAKLWTLPNTPEA